MPKIKVLVIDDSALVRGVLSKIINSHADMEVVGQAPDPFVARDLIKKLQPDVLTLDVEMPRMNGIDFLEKLMRLHPMPVLMVSTLTERGNQVTLRALELGAVDFITKPSLGIKDGLADLTHELGDKIRAAAMANVKRLGPTTTTAKPLAHTFLHTTEKIIFIGSSTGGTEALKEVLLRMPHSCPAIMVTQHMPEAFTKSFAQRLDGISDMTVKEAEDNERVVPGHVYIAPGHSHLSLKKSGAYYYTELSQSEPVNRHRPSVDVLFHSAAKIAGPNAMGIMLTGMGKDGAQGMLEMRHAGAYTIAQDADSCVVFGMPKAAIDIGAVATVSPLLDIASCALTHLGKIST